MLEQDKFIELLSREERSGECWSIKLNGTPIWPLIRFSAYFAWRNKKGSYGDVKDVSLKINADKSTLLVTTKLHNRTYSNN